MKKSKARKATPRPVRPVTPVIAVRVPAPLHARITITAELRGQSLSETMAQLITQGLDWSEAFGDHREFFQRQREEVRRLLAGDIKAGLLARGWTIVRDSKGGAPVELFAPPEAGFPRSAFIPTDHSD